MSDVTTAVGAWIRVNCIDTQAVVGQAIVRRVVVSRIFWLISRIASVPGWIKGE